MCQVSFCGIGIQNRCVATPLMAQQPHGLTDVGDLIQSSEVYDAFDGNAVEVEIMLDYLTAQRISPKEVYREVCYFFPVSLGSWAGSVFGKVLT